jgi:hypothetical protein
MNVKKINKQKTWWLIIAWTLRKYALRVEGE